MELELKTRGRATGRHGGQHFATVDDVKRREADLNAELELALAEADASRIVSLKREIETEIPLHLASAEISDTAKQVRALQDELESQTENREILAVAVQKTFEELEAERERLKPFEERFKNASFNYGLAKESISHLQQELRAKSSALHDLRANFKATYRTKI